MALAPAVFWSLTPREFEIKHRAFVRAEDRHRALFFELALMTGHRKPEAKQRLEKAISSLRQYPQKPWLPRPKRRP